jgi:hypothetical protein
MDYFWFYILFAANSLPLKGCRMFGIEQGGIFIVLLRALLLLVLHKNPSPI